MRAELKAPGGKLLKVECKVEEGILKEVRYTGDFFLVPEETIDQLEEHLRNTKATESTITQKTASFFNTENVSLIGLEPKHFTEVIMLALKG